MNLEPVGHDAHGRTLFRIHGDSRTHPGTASQGCIVLAPEVRQRIARNADRQLVVTE